MDGRKIATGTIFAGLMTMAGACFYGAYEIHEQKPDWKYHTTIPLLLGEGAFLCGALYNIRRDTMESEALMKRS